MGYYERIAKFKQTDTYRRLEEARQHVEDAKREALAVEAQVVEQLLLATVDLVPEIVGIGYDASWEYDDEGSYSWHVSPRVEMDGSDYAESWEETLYDRRDEDDRFEEAYYIFDHLCGLDVEAWQAATGSDDPEYGRVSVAELRERCSHE